MGVALAESTAVMAHRSVAPGQMNQHGHGRMRPRRSKNFDSASIGQAQAHRGALVAPCADFQRHVRRLRTTGM